MPSFAATIVICTHNRAELLRQCLMSLQLQLRDRDAIEVLVIDNNSSDDTNDTVNGLVSAFPHLRCVFEPRQGLSHARNRGVAETEADWIAFLDDDARVLPGYVDRLLQLVRDGGFDLVGGVYVPWYAEGKAAWFRDSYASNASVANEAGRLPEGRFASGGVMLVRKAALQGAGTFDPRLGMEGSQLGYGEETRMQVALRHAGASIGFDPQWRVEHLAPRAKQRVGWLLASAWAVGRDSWRAFDRQPCAISLLGLVRRLFSRPMVGIWQEVRSRDERSAWQNLLLAMGRPFLMTLGELATGVRLMLER